MSEGSETPSRMKPKANWIWLMAWRDTRRTRGKLALFGFSVIFGVAALVAVNSLRGNLEAEVDRQSRALLGADLEFQSREPFTEESLAFFESLGASDEASESRLSTMAVFEANGGTRLVSLRAMDGGFPWYGTLDTRPEGLSVADSTDRVALVEESLRLQYDLEIGDTIRIGETQFEMIGEILTMPGESSFGSAFSPRILIPAAFLEETELLGFGSRQTFRKRYFFEGGVTGEMEQQLEAERFELRRDSVRFDTAEEQKEEISGMLDQMTSYLSLVGFVALLLGGVGIAGAVQVYLKEKSGSMAVLRCLGCSTRDSMWVFCIQIAIVGFIGCSIGTLLGVATQMALPQIVEQFLPFELPFEFVWGRLAEAFGFAWILTTLFAFLPLLPLRRLSPMRAIRTSMGVRPGRKDWLVWATTAAIAALGLLFSILQTDRLRDAVGFFGGLIAAILALAAIGVALRSALRRIAPDSFPFVWKQGLSNLYRPNNRSVSLVVMIGMGAFLIYTLYLCEVSILKRGEINDQDSKPNTIFFDVQTDQVDDVKSIAAEQGADLHFHDPMVSMRLTRVRGQTTRELRESREPVYERWALSREYRSTYRDQLRDHETLIEGDFKGQSSLGGQEPIPISVEQRMVEALHLKLGDVLNWDVQGFPVETRVDSIRKVDWRQMQPNFFVVFPAGVLEAAPANHLVALRAEGTERIATLQGKVVKRFSNVSAINLEMVLNSLQEIFDKIGLVVRFMASFTILTGLIALITTVLTSRYQRVRESVLLRSIGASVAQVRSIMGIEYFLLGGIGSLSGILLSLGGAWAMTRYLFKIDLYIPWGVTIGAVLVIGTLTLVTGMLNSLGIAKRSPLEALRYE
ncbi:MAG: hypothetical protein CBD18_03005 [Opitutales bacterium TMED158]|nr:MAG: hypothetical protein CBD18_03005 [Opitutales bacterium TMED158]